jgi:prophage antirepressor-like protein
MTTIVDGDGNPWWVASEVCKVLGYAKFENTVATLRKYAIKDDIAIHDVIGRM